MQVQHPVQQMRSLSPILALSPIYSIQRKPWYKVYKAQCMVPFPMFSIKIVYIITFIAYKIYVRIQLYLIPMVFPSAFPIQFGEENNPHQLDANPKPIPIACYSFNCIYCARCNLGMSCRSHVPGYASQEKQSEKKEEKMEAQQHQIVEKKVEEKMEQQ